MAPLSPPTRHAYTHTCANIHAHSQGRMHTHEQHTPSHTHIHTRITHTHHTHTHTCTDDRPAHPQPPTPTPQVNAAIEDVLLEAACEEDEGLDFAAFAALVRVPSEDLDHYDARLPGTGRGAQLLRDEGTSGYSGAAHPAPRRSGSFDEGSRRRSGEFAVLEPVPEADA